MATPRPQPKAQARITIKLLDVRRGTYRVLSSDGETWYITDVRYKACSCPAGQQGFAGCKAGACKHLLAARMLAKVIHDRWHAHQTLPLLVPTAPMALPAAA